MQSTHDEGNPTVREFLPQLDLTQIDRWWVLGEVRSREVPGSAISQNEVFTLEAVARVGLLATRSRRNAK